VRLGADGVTEITSGLEDIEITSFERDPAGNLIIIGTDLAGGTSIVGQIDQSSNSLNVISAKPFQIDVKRLTRLN